MRYLKFASLSVALGLFCAMGVMAAAPRSAATSEVSASPANQEATETTRLLKQIRHEAWRIEDSTDTLGDSAHFASVDWETHTNSTSKIEF